MAIINFVRDYQRIARFRFGRFQGMLGPGVVFVVPIVHQMRKVDTRTEVLEIPRQTNITKDNASIDIDFLVYMRVDINEAEKAVLEVEDYHMAVVGLATTTLRTVTGDIALDEVLSQRERINELIRERLDRETNRWGIKVTNVEIKEIAPPREIQEAMTRQMTAERVRRAVVLEADGTRQAAITIAGGDKQAAILRVQGFREALHLIFNVARNVDGNTMGLQYLDTLKTLGNSPSSKFIFPMEFTNLLGSIGIGGRGGDERGGGG